MIEDRVRKVLADRAGRIDSDQDAWGGIQDGLKRRQRRSRLIAVAGGSLSAVVVGIVLVALWASLPRPDESGETPGTIAPASPPAVSRIPVGLEPRALVVGDGAVWASVNDGESRSIIRIDAASGEIVTKIELPDAPGYLAMANGALWADLSDERGPVLFKIDTETNRVVATVPGVGGQLAADAQGVWTEGPQLDDGASSIARVDSTTNEVVKTVRVSRPLWDIELGEGALWTLEADPGGGSNGTRVVRRDPVTGEAVASVAVEATWIRMAVGAGFVWFGGMRDIPEEGSVRTDVMRIDVDTNVLAGPMANVALFRPVAVIGDGVWFLGGPQAPQGLCRLGVQSLRVEMCVDVGQAADLAFDPIVGFDTKESAWIANFSDSVTHASFDVPSPGT